VDGVIDNELGVHVPLLEETGLLTTMLGKWKTDLMREEKFRKRLFDD